MKILHISMYSWAAGGLSKFVFDHAARQAAAGNSVEILTVIDEKDKIYDVPTGVKLNAFHPNFLSKILPFFSIKFYKFLKKNAADFDIIHIHGVFHFGSIMPFFFAKEKPKIVTIHGMLEKWALANGKLKKQLFSAIIQRKLLKNAKFLHVFHNEEWQDVSNYLGGNPKNLFMLPNGIDIAAFENLPKKGNFKAKLGLDETDKIVFFIGRLNIKKGLDILLPAFQKFAQENTKTFLVLAGPDDGYEAETRKFIEKNKLEKRILLAGMITGNEKLAAFADADIFVLPSYSEGFSIAVLEAMAAQIPCLVSEKVGFADEIFKNEAGKIIDLNSESIYEGIKTMIGDENYCKPLKINALTMLRQQYDINKIAQKLLNEYQK